MTDDQKRANYALAMFRGGRDTVQIASFLEMQTAHGKPDEAKVVRMLAQARELAR